MLQVAISVCIQEMRGFLARQSLEVSGKNSTVKSGEEIWAVAGIMLLRAALCAWNLLMTWPLWEKLKRKGYG